MSKKTDTAKHSQSGDSSAPQLYLIAPVAADPAALSPRLTEILENFDVACVRIPGAGGDEAKLGRLADAIRDIAHAHDVAVVIEDHIELAQRHGLDGVHLTTGSKQVRYARKELGADAIIGAGCGLSRHDGLNAAEAGADYVSFAPAGETALGSGEDEDAKAIFQWWSEMIEVPVVAEGALDAAAITQLSAITDFFAIGPEIWDKNDPLKALGALWT